MLEGYEELVWTESRLLLNTVTEAEDEANSSTGKLSDGEKSKPDDTVSPGSSQV